MTNRTARQYLALVTLGLLAVLCASCAGANASVVANEARYPISMSPVVRDKGGQLLERAHLQRVGRLSASSTKFAVGYSLVVPRTYDISEEVNAQVAAVGGEAVVNVSVRAGDGCGILNMFPFLNALPIWPGCVPVTVEGDIVKRAAPAPSGP